MQLLAIASHPGSIRRLGGRRRRRASRVAYCLTLAVMGAGTVLVGSLEGRRGGGHEADTGHGQRRRLAGSSCANSVQCMAVGITLNNLNSNGTNTPLVEIWTGSSWTLGAPQAAAEAPPAAASSTSVASVDPTAGRSGLLSAPAVGGDPVSGADRKLERRLVVDGPESGTCWPRGGRRASPGSELPRQHPVASQSDTRPTRPAPTSTRRSSSGTDLPGAWGNGRGYRTGLRSAEPSRVSYRRRLLGHQQRRVDPQNPNFLPIYPGAAGDQGIIEHWDGSSWSLIPSANEPSPDGGYLNGITCVDADRLLGIERDHGQAAARHPESCCSSGTVQVGPMSLVPFPTPHARHAQQHLLRRARCRAGRWVSWGRPAAAAGATSARKL